MANIHQEFQDFKVKISLSSAKNKRLQSSKDKIQNDIKKYFKQNSKLRKPEFWIQGSYKMRTIIRKDDFTYDLDLGVYFRDTQQLKPISLQKNVMCAIKDSTTAKPKHLEKCVRVIYQGDYNIDLPVFWRDHESGKNWLATKKGWKEDDAKEMNYWFESIVDKRGQLKRIIRYTKFWASQQNTKMPSGIAFTIWLSENFKKHSRDEVALRNTLKRIYEKLELEMACINPINQNEDFIEKLIDSQKDQFKHNLRRFIVSLNAAIRSQNKLTAIEKMNIEFNHKFS